MNKLTAVFAATSLTLTMACSPYGDSKVGRSLSASIPANPSALVLTSQNETLYTDLTASWTPPPTDEGAELSAYDIALGTSEGGTDLVDWTRILNTQTQYTFSGLQLASGVDYVATIRSVSAEGQGAEVASSAYGPIPLWKAGGTVLSNSVQENSEFPVVSLIDSQNRLLVAGYIKNTSDDAAIWRYNLDGSLDTSFGTHGLVVWDSPHNKNDRLYKLHLKDDGSIWAGGITQDASSGAKPNFPLFAQLDSNGQPNTAFSATGFKQLIAEDGKIVYLSGDVIFDEQDRFLWMGSCYGEAWRDLCAMRYTNTGDLDTSFATDGYLQWDHSHAPLNGASVQEYIGKGVYDSGYYYLIAGNNSAGQSGTILKIAESDGSVVGVLADIPCKIRGLTTSNDSVFFSGYTIPADDMCWGKASKDNLQLDANYGNAGTQSQDISLSDVRNRAYEIAVNENAEAYLCGFAQINDRDAKLVKIAASGEVETDFGDAGIMTFSDLYGVSGTRETCRAPVLLPNNSMYVFGYSETEISSVEYYRSWIKLLPQ